MDSLRAALPRLGRSRTPFSTNTGGSPQDSQQSSNTSTAGSLLTDTPTGDALAVDQHNMITQHAGLPMAPQAVVMTWTGSTSETDSSLNQTDMDAIADDLPPSRVTS
jgi:hypothetical protein